MIRFLQRYELPVLVEFLLCAWSMAFLLYIDDHAPFYYSPGRQIILIYVEIRFMITIWTRYFAQPITQATGDDQDQHQNSAQGSYYEDDFGEDMDKFCLLDQF